jgi:hypothetical protein
MGGESPERGLDAVAFLEIDGPDDLAGLGFEAEEIALDAEGVELARFVVGRAARAVGIGDVDGAGVFVLPFEVTGLGVEAEDAFDAGIFLAGEVVLVQVGVGDEIGQEDEAIGDCGAGVAVGDLDAPEDFGAALGKGVEDAFFAPDVVALRAHPLRPIIGVGGANDGQCQNQSQYHSHKMLLEKHHSPLTYLPKTTLRTR